MGFPVTIQTRFGALFAGHRTNHTARGKHARVETGRNMPGTPGKDLSTLNYATSCRTFIWETRSSSSPGYAASNAVIARLILISLSKATPPEHE